MVSSLFFLNEKLCHKTNAIIDTCRKLIIFLKQNFKWNPIKHVKMLKLMPNLVTTQPFTLGYVILGSPVESNKHEPQVRKWRFYSVWVYYVQQTL